MVALLGRTENSRGGANIALTARVCRVETQGLISCITWLIVIVEEDKSAANSLLGVNVVVKKLRSLLLPNVGKHQLKSWRVPGIFLPTRLVQATVKQPQWAGIHYLQWQDSKA
jgi:hypothetical protein